MTTMTVNLRSIPGTHAAVGWAEGHTIVVDRPDGRAGGMGLGLNGGQLLGFAIGGCFCNDLQYVAHDMDVSLTSVEVEVTVTLEGNPLHSDPCEGASGGGDGRSIQSEQHHSSRARNLDRQQLT